MLRTLSLASALCFSSALLSASAVLVNSILCERSSRCVRVGNMALVNISARLGTSLDPSTCRAEPSRELSSTSGNSFLMDRRSGCSVAIPRCEPTPFKPTSPACAHSQITAPCFACRSQTTSIICTFPSSSFSRLMLTLHFKHTRCPLRSMSPSIGRHCVELSTAYIRTCAVTSPTAICAPCFSAHTTVTTM